MATCTLKLLTLHCTDQYVQYCFMITALVCHSLFIGAKGDMILLSKLKSKLKCNLQEADHYQAYVCHTKLASSTRIVLVSNSSDHVQAGLHPSHYS